MRRSLDDLEQGHDGGVACQLGQELDLVFQRLEFILFSHSLFWLLDRLERRLVDSFMIYTEVMTINAGGPRDATTFLSLQLGEEIKGFSYGSAAARAMVNFLFVLTLVWVFIKLRQSKDRARSKVT